ncbi:hypothetical protein Q3G72_024096 [Acer saccharum]|nr:hypothetical protein Q3G72_024096 [Acer saccharum]
MSLGLFHCQGRLDSSFLGYCVPPFLPKCTVLLLREVKFGDPDSSFKVNVDTTLDKSRGISVWVWWLETKWAGAKCFNGLIKAETAETSAILEGVHLAISENLNLVIVESDTINAINLYSGISLSRCEVDNIVQDVHDFIRENTNNISLCFSPRSCNLVAHSVAKWALGSGSSTFWISSFLDWLCKLIKKDGFVDLSVV